MYIDNYDDDDTYNKIDAATITLSHLFFLRKTDEVIIIINTDKFTNNIMVNRGT